MLRGTGATSSVIHAAGSPGAGVRARPKALVVLVKMNRLTSAFTASSSRLSVPVAFVSTCGWWSVAQCTTAPTPATERRTASRSATDAAVVVYGEGTMSSPVTSWPGSGRKRISASPRWPELPVTRILTGRDISERPKAPPSGAADKSSCYTSVTVTAVPQVELHVHLEGTAPPDLVSRIAERNGIDLPERLLGDDGRFRYGDFLDFLATYDLAASVIRTGEDYRDITYEYLCSCARGGAI